MLLSDVLAIKGKTLYTISPQKPLADALTLMSDLDVGSLVVMDQGALAGILTFREALAAIHAAGADWQSVPVGEVMAPFSSSTITVPGGEGGGGRTTRLSGTSGQLSPLACGVVLQA